MVKSIVLIGAACVITCTLTVAQQLRFNNVRKLPSSVNTSAEEAMPLLSHDGKTLFFTRAFYPGNTGGKFSGLDIWTSDRTGHHWTPAKNSLPFNDRDHNVVVGLGERNLYFTRASGWKRTPGIHVTTKNSTGFSTPELIPIPGIENYDFLSFYVSPDLDVIFLSMKADDSRGQEDIYFSVKTPDGTWSKPKNIGATVNTSGYEISPFLSPDKRRLYFSSNGHNGYGDADIFYSERMYDSWETWSVPVNLGPAVNSDKFDAYFSIYGDTIGFFTSNRDGRYADVYQVDVSTVQSILRDGQRYLAGDALARQLGPNVNRSIVFDKDRSALDAAESELLFFIVNKLMLERDVHFHLVVREENDSALTGQRLRAVSEGLRRHGIDGSRIHLDQVEPALASDRAVVEILLFR